MEEPYNNNYPLGNQASAAFKVDFALGQGIEYSQVQTDGITR